MNLSYDTIGVNYSDLRKPDPRIAQVIHRALGTAKTVINIGAGAGSYEPSDRRVTAVEPSRQMIEQRTDLRANVVQGFAESLPFEDKAFDAAMAILTVHHWSDQDKGLQEMRRVTTGPVVLLTFQPAFRNFWLTDYFPELITLDEGQMPSMAAFRQWLGPVDVTVVRTPHDCIDGFLSAYWRRPAAYLDERIRAAMSPFWALGDVSAELKVLRDDIQSGQWMHKYGHLLALDALDCGYRLVVAR